MKITKKQCLRAVAREPLRAGLWIRGRWSDKLNRATYNKTCQVCAVGAVLRTCGVPNREIQSRASELHAIGAVTNGRVDWLLEAGYYLNALSCYYESLNRSMTLPKQRETLAAFITKHFPDTFEVKL